MTQSEGLKILIVGSSILEHALAKKLQKSPRVKKIFVAPGNAGISEIAECLDIQESAYPQLIKFAKQEKIDLTFVGPYRLIAEGIADHFHNEGLKIFCPRAKDAEIGSSRVIAKELMRHYSIPTPAFHIFDYLDGALTYCEHARFPLIIKIDGTALGGTAVCNSMEDVHAHLDKAMKEKIFGESGERVIIENFVTGQAVSSTLLIDRNTLIPFPSCQIIRELVDNKRVPVRLGAFTPTSCLNQRVLHQIERQILVPLVHAISSQAKDYKHFLTVDIVVTDKGPMVLDFKVQWNDLMAQILLSRFEGDFLEMILAVVEGKTENLDFAWSKELISGIVLIKDPGKIGGIEIPDPKTLDLPDNVELFFGKSKKLAGKIMSTGDRVLGITAAGKDMEENQKSIEAVLAQLNLEDVFYKNLPTSEEARTGKVKAR